MPTNNGEGLVPKRRGRPPKEKKEAPTDLHLRIAEIIHNDCGVPGCSAKWHLDAATKIVEIFYS